MERELWPPWYRARRAAARDVQQTYVRYQPRVIAAAPLWAALHGRPVSWACDPARWAATRPRPARLPDQSTVSRRMRRVAFDCLLNRLADRPRGAGLPALVLAADGRPLLVGGNSKDPDAKSGRAAGHKGRGYKRHAVWAGRPLPGAWEATPLNEHEARVADRLFGRPRGGGYALADANSDASHLSDRAAGRGYRLVAAQADDHPGRGRHYVSPHRPRCIDPLGGAFGREAFALRARVERALGNAPAFGGGLGPLPAWVRRRHRVEHWVWAKPAINAARIRKNQGPAP